MGRPLSVRRVASLFAGALLLGAAGGRGYAQVPVCTPPPSGMVAWWPGDGSANDIAGANNGAVVGGVTYTGGEVAQAFSLDGSTGYVQVPDAASLRITGQITIDAWIHPSALGGRVVDKITAGGADGYLLDTYGGVVRLIVDGVGLSGLTTIPVGTWSHIAGVYDGAQMRVYLNGALDNSSSTSVAIPTNTLNLRIGADSTGSNLFAGQIDEVELLGRALSQPEIQAIVAAGAAGKCKTATATSNAVPTTPAAGLVGLAVLLAVGAFLVLRTHPA